MGERTEIDQLIDDCTEREGRLNDWQRGFVDSIQKQRVDGKTLTKAQTDALNDVWEFATKEG